MFFKNYPSGQKIGIFRPFDTTMKKITLLLFALFLSGPALAQVQSPDSFLGYPLGTTFSRHHQVVDYFQHLEENSNMVRLDPYGTTDEGRLLQLAYVSTAKNLAKLEAIRQRHLQNTGLIQGEKNDDFAIVWLSFNVHGNESSSTEAAMKTIYNLIENHSAWLENTVVIIDPCINPDGRDRYVNWYKQNRSTPYDATPFSREHDELWHSGRTNHYIFDLNRDWAWATQVETQQRLKKYNQWLPHVHVDFHEQGINSPYYFAPAAAPLHDIITPFQMEFQDKLAKNHALYFDREGWLYFTKERFDLLYPSYGDTYPTYLGAIGMTYEQAGNGRAGLGITNDEGIELTLIDRIEHHYTTALSTVETAAKNRSALNANFQAFFEDNKRKYQAYVLEGSTNKLKALQRLLDRHEVDYGYLNQKQSIKGYDYQQQKNSTIAFQKGALVVPSQQVKGKMVQVWFEPKTTLQDSLTYDITAWSLPYAHGLKAVATNSKIEYNVQKTTLLPQPITPDAYAWGTTYDSFEDGKFLAALLKANIKVRINTKRFGSGGKNWNPGSLFILRGENTSTTDFEVSLNRLAQEYEKQLIPVASGYAAAGPDMGSDAFHWIKTPKIAILTEGDVSPYNYGELWHYFEKDLNFPFHQVRDKQLTERVLKHIDVLIMPSGGYSSLRSERKKAMLLRWLRQGGRIVAIERALSYFTGQQGFNLQRKENDITPDPTRRYEDQQRNYISNAITGGIFNTRVDNSHPIGLGYTNNYYTLKRSASAYALLKNGNNVSYIPKGAKAVAGFVGKNVADVQAESLIVGTERVGRGSVTYFVDDPIFRAFWENGKLLLFNAVFLND